jgi:hypothetical protein
MRACQCLCVCVSVFACVRCVSECVRACVRAMRTAACSWTWQYEVPIPHIPHCVVIACRSARSGGLNSCVGVDGWVSASALFGTIILVGHQSPSFIDYEKLQKLQAEQVGKALPQGKPGTSPKDDPKDAKKSGMLAQYPSPPLPPSSPFKREKKGAEEVVCVCRGWGGGGTPLNVLCFGLVRARTGVQPCVGMHVSCTHACMGVCGHLYTGGHLCVACACERWCLASASKAVAPGLGSPLPHLRWDWAHPWICVE